jgi:hemoglobin/transferrin/lactoferrin receptor protein
MIRGFATNRLIYTVDGIRMNTAIFRGGNIQNVINLDPFATENTEVLFGPGSVIYGSDAIGGVMSFQTLTPQLSLTDQPLVSGKAVARFATANQERTGHFHVNLGWKKWAFVTSISSWNYDHLRQGSNGPVDYLKDYFVQRQNGQDLVVSQEDPLLQKPSAYSQMNLMQKVRFKPNENWDFQYGFHYSETSSYGRYDRHTRISNALPRHGEWDYGPQSWLMNNLTISHQGNHLSYDQMTLRLAQQSFGESRISRNFNSTLREIREEQVEALSANLDFTKGLNERHTLYYGLEFVQNNVASKGLEEEITSGVVSEGVDRYPQANWRSMAAYINEEFRINQLWTLQAGLRYNQFLLEADFSQNADFFPFPFAKAEINNGALTGSMGAVFRPTETWAIKANLGTGFRAPNVDDIGKIFDSEPGVVVVPNPNLKAEYAYNIDLSIAKVINDKVKLDITGFYTVLDNALVRRTYQLNGLDSILYDGVLSEVQAIQNAAQARVYGLQFGVEAKLPEGFSISTDLNFQKGEEELNNGSVGPSRHAAPFFGVSRLSYRNQKLDLQFYALFQGEQSHRNLAVSEKGKTEIYALDANSNTYAPAWYTLNFKAAYSLSEKIRISAGLENITDQRYRSYSSGISGAGRNFMLALAMNF